VGSDDSTRDGNEPRVPSDRPPDDPSATRPPKLLDRVRTACRLQHFSRRTEEAYAGWIRRYILFHQKRHPATLGAAHVTAFLSSLATDRHVSASTQNQALNPLLFLYRSVLHAELEPFQDIVRARTPVRLPVVLTRDEVRRLLASLEGVPRLVASLLYGSGLRLLECLELRVKDIDLERCEITVRRGKGGKDRRTVLPSSSVPPLSSHLARVQSTHAADLLLGLGRVAMPDALRVKFPNADRSWQWHADVSTTMIYTHVLNRGGSGVRSPADRL
jgi:integron integrase